MIPKKKIEIVIDAVATDEVVALLQRSGAKGHTLVPHVSGEGHRDIRASYDVFEPGHNVLIISIVSNETAERIIAGVLELLETHAGIMYTSDVQVARSHRF